MGRRRFIGAVTFATVISCSLISYQNCAPQSNLNPGLTTDDSAAGLSTGTSTGSLTTTGTSTGTWSSTAGTTSGTTTVTKTMMGALESVTRDGSGTHIKGWACLGTIAQSVPVNLYANNAKGSGGSYFITAVTANAAVDSAVSAKCGTSNIPHRFDILLSPGTSGAYQGMRIFLYSQNPESSAYVDIYEAGQSSNGTRIIPRL